ncbi:unnamed protein product [Paramecium sonneborni]|uniref:Uncharacterized protein n=1 Tax=Paramecium sonneborni TaxID=65129 RepID=A0A8S1L579_9CILI|nr:unnamed protein product [Paramecium sonneborni]
MQYYQSLFQSSNLFCTIDKPHSLQQFLLNQTVWRYRVRILVILQVYTLPQTQIYSIQGVEAPSTMKLIKVSEYSLKVLGEITFITNFINNLHIMLDRYAKRNT